jgi:dienelactone hydrolase
MCSRQGRVVITECSEVWTSHYTPTMGTSWPRTWPSTEGAVTRAVVVIQEIFGVNHHIRSVTDGFARDVPCNLFRVS